MTPKFRVFYKPLNKYKRLANLNFDSREQKLRSVTLWNDGDFDEGEWVRPVPADEVELEQFTGLVDKYGKEIFVGDIVKMPPEITIDPKRIGVVEFGYGCFYVKDDEYEDGKKHVVDFYDYNDPAKDFEVVGNIHEEKK